MALVDRLEAGEVLFTQFSTIPDPLVAELLATTALDSVTLDAQHGGHTDASILRCAAPIIAAGKHVGVRIPVGRWDLATAALDVGAEWVIAPVDSTPEMAGAFARAVKFTPIGERSWGPNIALRRHGLTPAQYQAEGNRRSLAFVMIETMLGYQNIDAILDVEGVDGIFIGNNDLSFDMTRGKSLEPMSPEVLRICEQCMKKARARGKYGAIFLTQIQFMRSYLEMGFQMFVGGLDSRALVDTGNRFVAEAKAEFRA